ncbi:ABC transporter substrate-binding protein [Nocardioides sp. Root1257]|uniref:sugar ABC transporter substrate-binding protein n=1 Tax=unclassified Nocardioides TaxID=2615069 RepID=UPI0006F60195|nr:MULTISPECIES: sugar ABC transporter substrate-binding protein [unclassified Nocardioides]KQW49085.1 ABC transporter substrate-binding protein [Nocardioides sp. Root1257]KRC48259.1 ABC transporter substrate-binding protein [Nocardioides sp. Root224]
MKRTTATIAGLAVAGLLLTSCGRSDDAGAGGEAQSTAIADGKAKGTIEVWAMGTEGEKLGDFVDAFEDANPDADVKVTAVPWESAHDKISTAIAAGKGPDVSLIGTTWMGEFAEAGGLMPTPEGLVDEADYFPGAWQSTEVGGTSYGVPWYVETRVLFYRKDLAKKAGWAEAPTSWDDLKKFAEDLKSKGGAKYGLNLQPGQTGSWQSYLPFAWSDGATLTNDDGTEYTIDSPEMAEALDYYTSYFDDGLSMTRTLDPGELEGGFADGSIGSFISGPWHTGLVEDAGLDDSQYAVAPLPGKDDGMGTSFVGGGDLAVFKDTDNADGAWKFVQWLSQPDVQQDFYDEVGDLPSVQSAWDTGELSTDPQLKVFGEQLKEAQSPPAVPTWEQVAASIDGLVEQASRGDLSGEDAVKQMQSDAQSIGTGL